MIVWNEVRATCAFFAAFFLLIVGAMPAQANEKNCSARTAVRRQEEEKRIDTQKAIALAKAEKDFGRKTKGYKAELTSIYFVHSFNPKNSDYQGLESVNLVYGLSKADMYVKNVVAHVDAKLKGLKTVSEHETDRRFVLDHTSKGWSGYVAAALKNSGTAYETLFTANVQWTVPTISTPDVGDLLCAETSCDVAAWVGLYAGVRRDQRLKFVTTRANRIDVCSQMQLGDLFRLERSGGHRFQVQQQELSLV